MKPVLGFSFAESLAPLVALATGSGSVDDLIKAMALEIGEESCC